MIKRLFLYGIGLISIMVPGFSLAQSIPGGSFQSSINPQNTLWYFDQSRRQQPYSVGSCTAANVNTRYYLAGDIDADGLPDRGQPYYLRDNFRTVGGDNAVNLGFLTVRSTSTNTIGTNIEYYTPSNTTNVLSLLNGTTQLPIDTNRTWYRQSTIAPKNIWVRAVESEPVLYEAPSTKRSSDAYFQVTYNIRWKDYDSINDTATSTYPLNTVIDGSYGGPVNATSLWYLNTLVSPIPSYDAFYGPNRSANYLNNPGSTITSKRINRQAIEKTHGLECFNIHLSRCGDGYIDVSGQQPTNGSTTQPHIISDSGVSEVCDPGANLDSYTDDVMPGGATPTATYNCTATCTIPAAPVTLALTKQQRNVTTNTPANGTYQSAAISFSTNDDVEFKMTVSTASVGTATNVVLTDTLPVGFVLSSAANAVTVDGVNTVVTVNASNVFTLPLGTLVHPQTKTIIVRGKMTNATSTTTNYYNNTVSLTYSTPTNPTNTVGPITVIQTPTIPDPVFALTKEVKNVTLAGQFYQADTQGDAVAVSGGHTIQYKLTVAKSGGPVTQSVKVTDTFPTSGITLTSLTVAGVAQSLPISNPFDIIIPASAFASTNTVEILMNATVSPSASANAYVNQSLLYYGSSGVPVDAGIDNNAWVSLQPGTPKLDIDKTFKDANGTWVDQIPRTPGQSFEMKLEVTNIGSSSAPDVFVRDLCDNRITCTSYSYYYSTSPTTIIPGGNITNNLLLTPDIAPINGLAPGQKIIIIVQGSVLATTAGGITIPNTAGVYDQIPNTDGSNAVDTDPASIVTPILNKDFEIIKTGSGTLNPGSVVTYTFRIRNVGQDIISAYILTDPLPAGMTYVPGTTKINGVLNSLYDPSISNGILTRGCASGSNQLNSTGLCPLSVNGSGSLSFDARVNQ